MTTLAHIIDAMMVSDPLQIQARLGVLNFGARSWATSISALLPRMTLRMPVFDLPNAAS